MFDGMVRRANQMAAGAGNDLGPLVIGRSRVGLTTKTVAPTDAIGKLVDFAPLPGQAHGPRRSKR